MKKWIKIAGMILFLAVLIMGTIFLVAWRSPKYYVAGMSEQADIIPFSTYTADHPKPYVIARKDFVVFGAEHTKDPNHPQLLLLKKHWDKLQPTVALVESRLGFLLPGFMDPVKTLGEGGKVKALANKASIPVYTWDLSKEVLAEKMSKKFSAEQIAVAQILNPYFGQLRFGRPSDPEAFVAPFLKRAAYVGLQDSITSVAQVDAIWKKYFPALDWRNETDEDGLPGYLGEMMAYGNDLRNQHLINVVNDLRAKGERVFLVCGSSHAYCVNRGLR
jgi:hypothetical protein